MKSNHFFSVLFAAFGCAVASVNAQPSRAFWQQESASRVHDPSTIVREGNEYWMFSTGMGIKSHHSTNLLDWQSGPPVLPQMPDWVRDVVPDQRGHYWAPDVINVGGRWLLYYSVSSFGKNTSAIALLSNPTLDPKNPQFKWTDEGIVVRSLRTNQFNTIDPAVSFDAAGRLWLAFGSYWTGIKLIELDAQTGKRIAPDSPMHSLAWNDHIEAAYLHREGTNYYLFVNWGQCCQGTNSSYEIRVGRSADITGPYRDRDGHDLLHAGGTKVISREGRFIGPGHAGIFNDGTQEWFSFHYYDGNNQGRPAIAVRKLSWDKDGWPVVAKSE
ncbi:MAG: Intracellular endo-alpha-(1-_5)-L-arabinanase [Verrucomicrobiota bacterium]|jgi:arabinan endo-1,5-alpha-L-arabinosidase